MIKQDRARISLARRLLFALFGVVGISTFIAMTVLYIDGRNRAISEQKQKAAETATYLQAALELPLWTLDSAAINAVARTLIEDRDIAALSVIDDAGRVIFTRAKQTDPDGARKVFDIVHDNSVVGRVELIISSVEYKKKIDDLMLAVAMVLFFVLVVMGFANALIVRALFKRPIAQLAEVTRAYADGEQSLDVESIGYIEFRPLLNSLSVMARRINSQITVLRKSEEQFRQIFENASIGMSVTSLEGRFTKVNQELCEITGYSAEELLQMSFRDLTDPDDLEEDLQHVDMLLRGEASSFAMEKRYIHMDGSRVWVNLRSSLVRDLDGKPVHFISTVENITERKEAVGALARSESEYRSLFENQLYGVAIAGPDRTFIRVNDAFCAMLGYAREEIIGKISMADITHPDDLGIGLEKVQALRRGEIAAFTLEKRYVTKTGDIVNAMVFAHGIHDENGNYVASAATMLDITQRKRAELGLLLSEQEYRSLFENQVLAISTTSPQGVFQRVNQAFCDLLEYSEEEIVGIIGVGDITHPDDLGNTDHNLSRVIAGEIESYKMEKRYITKSGRVLHCITFVRGVYGPDGECLGSSGSILDITEHKRASEKLRVSEQEYRSLFENQVYAIGVVDEKGVYERVNTAFSELFGYTPEEIVGKRSIADVTHPDDVGATDTNLALMKKGELSSYRIEKRYITKSRGTMYALTYVRGRFDENGKYIGAVGTLLDITERKRAEEALQRSEQEFRALFENQVYAISVVDKNGVYERANGAFCAMFGYDPEEIIGKLRVSDVVHPDDLERSVADLEKVISGETQSYKAERRYVTKYGEILNTIAFIRGQYDSDGNFLGAAGTLLDITERKRAEEALLRSEQEFRALFENQLYAIAVTDKNRVIKRVNDAFCRLFGYYEDELVDHVSMFELSHEEDLEIGNADYAKLIAGELRDYTLEKRYVARNGSVIEAMIFVQGNYSPSGELVASTISVLDITDRKHAERMKNEFLATVSHELRTPLTAIQGALGLVSNGYDSFDKATLRSMIDMAQRNSQRLLVLINDLLDIGKYEAEGLHFEMKVDLLSPQLEQAVENNKAYAQKYGATIELDDRTDGALVDIDDNRIQQILANLISNAAKYSPSGGVISVRAEEHGDRVIVSVEDQGPGIPDNFRHRIFQKFAQADSSDTRLRGGTGLGLFIAKSLVERMGGTIWFETEMGEGTKFHFDLPLANLEEFERPLARAIN